MRVTSEPWPDLTGGYHYLGLERMSYYVNKDAYRGAVRAATQALRTDAASRPSRRSRLARKGTGVQGGGVQGGGSHAAAKKVTA